MSIISLAEFGMANGGGDGGATILDLPSGALRSPFQFFIFIFFTILDIRSSGAVLSSRLFDFSKMYNSQMFLQLYSPTEGEGGRKCERGRE
jgi:hypothetical protein